MNQRTLSFLFLAFVLGPSAAIAQMGIAKGKVVDQDGKPIAGVAIRIASRVHVIFLRLLIDSEHTTARCVFC